MKALTRNLVGAGVAALGLLGSPDAHAAGFASARFGGEQGNPVATNPTALYYNPAGIAFSEGVDLFGDGELAIRSASWTHTAPQPGPSDQPNAQFANSGTASLLNVFGGPAIGGTMKLGNLAFGAGLFVPFGGRVYWNTNNVPTQGGPTASCAGASPVCPLAADGVQRWHQINAELTFIYISAGVAYKLGPLSVGVTGNFIDSSLKTTQARTLGGQVDSTVENRVTLDVNGFNGSFAAGAMLEAIPDRLWLGASYQAQPGMGPQTLKGSLTYVSGQQPFYSDTGTTKYDALFHQSLPDIFRGGARFRASDSVELRVFGDYTRWSVMTSQCINYAAAGTACQVLPDGSKAPGSTVLANLPRNWKDTYGVRVGGSYWLNPGLELFGGLGYETAAVPDSTMDPGAMDADNIGIAAGARIKITPTLYLAGSYTHLQYLDRNVTTSQLAVKNGVAVLPPTQQQDGNGQYQQWIGIFDANIEAKF